MNKRDVVIVIPHHRINLKSEELISLRHLKYYLGTFDTYFTIPKKLNSRVFNGLGYKTIQFSSVYFETWKGYNELLNTEEFYQAFSNYKYMLLHQLDALVFSNQLLKFCRTGYDYIGAPWFKPFIGFFSHKKGFTYNVGNGGLSLRKIDSFIKVIKNVNECSRRKTNSARIRKIWFSEAVLSGKSHKIWLDAPAYCYPFAEDGFWSLEAPKYYSKYKVAPFNVALKFSFEKQPRFCFALNKDKLPFGCHAWAKYDKEFWLPYLLK